MRDELDYGRALTDHWRDELIVVEHDVVPWPGAMQAISGCAHDWCVYGYPFAPRKIGHALGCRRVSARVIEQRPDLPKRWAGVAWNQLDAAVYKALGGMPHFHYPPLAHVKAHAELAA
jgi:hypothetical protein